MVGNKVNGEAIQSEQRSAMVISWLITNYRAAHTSRAKLKKLKWFKPQNWLIRVDLDASFDEFTFTGTKGVVIRDSNGHTLLEN
jgi:hypothetical protein